MNPWSSIKDRAVLYRKLDEQAHAIGAEEFRSGNIRTGLMAKAMIQCQGDEAKARATYLRLLVASIKTMCTLQ